MTTTLILERPLSLYENFFRCRTVNRYYNNFQVTATYSKPISISNLYGALRKVLLQYHVLACNVFQREKEYYMKPIHSISLQDVLIVNDDPKYLTDGVINELAMKYMNEFIFDLDSQKPLFKLILFDQHTLAVVLDHTLYDGLVGNYFHEVLLPYLAEEHIVNDADVMSIPLFRYPEDESLILHSLPPPIDDFLPSWDIDYSNNDPNHYDKLTPPGYTKFPGRFPNALGNSKAFKLVNFAASDLTRILSACKQHGVTLTSYLYVVFIHSFRPAFPDHYTLDRVAMNLRRFFVQQEAPGHYKHFFDTPNYKIMGNSPHLGLANNLPPLTNFTWEAVSEFNTNLQKSVANRNLLNVMKFFKDSYVPGNNSELFESKLGQNKAETTKLSNLGFVKVPELNGWTINDMIFSQDLSSVTSDFMISVVSTANGGLNVVITYFDHSFEDVDMPNFDSLVDTFRANVMKCTDD